MFGRDYAREMVEERRERKAEWLALGLSILLIMLPVGWTGFIVWALVHFIRKYW